MFMPADPVAITGLAVHTPLGDTPALFVDALLAGRSAIGPWVSLDMSRSPAKIGGDMQALDIMAKIRAQAEKLDPIQRRLLRRLAAPAPWSVRHSLSMAMAAWQDAGISAADPARIAVVVGGQHINSNYIHTTSLQFAQEPEWIEAQCALQGLDTHHAAAVSELIGAQGPLYTIGAACASGVHAIRAAAMEIRAGLADIAVVIGAVADLAPPDLHSLALMGALSTTRFAATPARASRPFDADRDGFVPAHGGAVIVLEAAAHAAARGARQYGSLLGAGISSDGSHLPQPTLGGQTRAMRLALAEAGILPAEVGLVSAHATSTPIGDTVELASILDAFGQSANGLPVIATKALTGHCLWSAALVETVAALLQVRAGRLHGAPNLDTPIEHGGLSLTAAAPRGPVIMKNAFGFGGINGVLVLRADMP